MARIAVAIAIWVGGRKPHGLPLLKWEMNGPGWDFGRQVVRTYSYPYYYRARRLGTIDDPTTMKYGWHSSREAKLELLTSYDRAIAHGGYVNHSMFALDEMLTYIYLPDGGIGPAGLVEESKSARATHGDCVIADALTLDEDDAPVSKLDSTVLAPFGSFEQQMRQTLGKKKQDKKISWKMKFDFR
jgi:hypothetical protein